MSHSETIAVLVSAIEQVTPLIKQFTLQPTGGGELPPFSGAATSLWSCGGGTGRSAIRTR